MANRRFTPEQLVRGGLTASYNSSILTPDTHQVANNGRVFFHFLKSGAGSCNVTFTTPGTVDGLAVADRVVVVPATTGDVFIGPFPQTIYNNGVNDIEFACSEVTGLTIGVFRL